MDFQKITYFLFKEDDVRNEETNEASKGHKGFSEAEGRKNTTDEDVSSELSKVSGAEERRDEDFSCVREDEAEDRNNIIDEDEDDDVKSRRSQGHSNFSVSEERNAECYCCGEKNEAGDRTKSSGIKSVNNDDSESEKFRKTKSGPKNFVVAIKVKTWKKIKPRAGSTQLQPPWMDVLYEEFSKVNPCCVLSFKYQHVKCKTSRKKRAPYFRAHAICVFGSCPAKYKFTIKTKPKPFQKHIYIHVLRVGDVTHMKN